MLSEYGRINTAVAVTTVGVVLAAAALTTWWRRKRDETRMPSKWRRVGELVELRIYPLKSGAGISLKEAECTDIGAQTTYGGTLKLRDRYFIVSTEAGVMKTARQNPKLFLIKVSLGSDNSVIFKAPGKKELIVHIPTGTPKRKNTFDVWKVDTESVDCGDEAAEWMHSYLGLKDTEKVRLGYHQDDCISRRDFNKKPLDAYRKVYNRARRFDTGAFSDMAPYMLINEASIMDLKKRIPKDSPLASSWFRPNFVVQGPEPLAEDDWNFIKIGDSAVFQYYKPCTRCIMTTMDPETGTKDPDMQPLKTLRQYRLLKDKKKQALDGEQSPVMGCNLGLREAGTVRVGDPVYVG